MAHDNQQDGTQPIGALPESGQLSKTGASRRRFAASTLGASGVILSVTSQSAMACICQTPSGSLSGTLNSHAPDPHLNCDGRSPGYWIQSQHYSDWPCSRTTTFYSVFGTTVTGKYKGYNVTASGKTTFHYTTLLDILDPQYISGDNEFGRHMCAAYLNAADNKVKSPSVALLKTIWTAVATYGYYQPAANVKWYKADIVEYIKHSMA